jgi:hypothetical protein
MVLEKSVARTIAMQKGKRLEMLLFFVQRAYKPVLQILSRVDKKSMKNE